MSPIMAPIMAPPPADAAGWNDGEPARVVPSAIVLATCDTLGVLLMAIEVRIPTILRTFTGGAKSVEGSGDTLDELIADLDSRHAGLRARLVDDAGLRRFVNVYLNDEDVRFLGGLTAPVKDGDTVTVLPAVAGGARKGRR
jgi:sulfur-carrier protein